MPHFLHYAGSTFQLPDVAAAQQLVVDIQDALSAGGTRLLHIRTVDAVVYIAVAPGTSVAVSGSDDVLETGAGA